MKLYPLGPCHCTDKQYRSNKNEIMCLTGTSLEQFHACQDDESCTGPISPHEAKLFSKSIFCTKGALKIL